jgi:hypothetical protein
VAIWGLLVILIALWVVPVVLAADAAVIGAGA